ncbi:hypothetical protein T492DRAFT_595839 [Pavlovales sp. CCMP2436]|nr:hypothetical protein T492DRAFT_595839 [Pavlovales sp. CCMP2436]|mmetsp:Transcript_29108/g.73032  ORF Transcript_29108/g.73032 Transcript_29108/m.73032 type:complete len:324 (-) Transcript_29108:292-1263(-)
MPKRPLEELEGAAKGDGAYALLDDVYIYAPCTLSRVNESRVNQRLQAVVAPQYLTEAHAQRTVRLRQLWGTDVYTDDSDLLAVLVHMGFVGLHDEGPRKPLLVTLAVCARQRTYASNTRYGLCSRAFGVEHQGVSYKIEHVSQYTGDPAELEPHLSAAAGSRRCLASVALLPPGYPPSSLHVAFNLSNEPMFKYSLALLADRGFEPVDWTSTRLRTEVIYLESDDKRYEISLDSSSGPQRASHTARPYDCYTFSEVLSPHALDAVATKKAGVPLPPQHLRVLHEKLDWEEIAWGRASVRIRSKAEYALERLQFVPASHATKPE